LNNTNKYITIIPDPLFPRDGSFLYTPPLYPLFYLFIQTKYIAPWYYVNLPALPACRPYGHMGLGPYAYGHGYTNGILRYI